MGDTTKIEWTDATWNPLRGCTRVSEGCRNCYAERLAARMSKPGMWGHGFAEMTPEGPRWTGRVELVESRLAWPIRVMERHRPTNANRERADFLMNREVGPFHARGRPRILLDGMPEFLVERLRTELARPDFPTAHLGG